MLVIRYNPPQMLGVPPDFCDQVRAAMQIPTLPGRILSLYRQIEKEIAVIVPRCEMSGRCCHFDEYGHRLFVTTAEMAAFVHDLRTRPVPNGLGTRPDGNSCRFQDDRMCLVHAIRPMGCRLFFCDPRHEQTLQSLYEAMHARLKDLHDEIGVPYAYVEWRQALSAVEPLWAP